MDNKVIGDYSAAGSIDGANHYLLIQPGNSSTAYNKINRNVFLGVTGQPADISTAQNITNKTLNNTNIATLRGDRFTLQDASDTTKQAVFSLSGITTATTRTYTLPNASSTLVDLSSSQTLTNKTLTSPTISGGSISNTTVSVNAITGFTLSTTGTVYGVSISSGTIGTAGYANGSVTPSKLATGATSATTAAASTTTNTSFANLADAVSTSVTVTIGTNGLALVIISAQTSNSNTAGYAIMGFAISGASTVAANDTQSIRDSTPAAAQSNRFSNSFLVSGLTAGSTTFTAQYKVLGNTGTFSGRVISVIPL